jgi:hypothetical protein
VAPLGVLAAAAVANGVFARIKLHTGWPDLQQISVDDVVALADRVQQLGSDASAARGRGDQQLARAGLVDRHRAADVAAAARGAQRPEQRRGLKRSGLGRQRAFAAIHRHQGGRGTGRISIGAREAVAREILCRGPNTSRTTEIDCISA